MGLAKNISLLFACFALLVVNVANAAMPCCVTNPDQPKAETRMDQGGMAMPCHDETTDNDEQNSAGCGGCDCQHCVKMSALPQYQPVKATAVSRVRAFTAYIAYSHQPEDIFQPPKPIS